MVACVKQAIIEMKWLYLQCSDKSQQPTIQIRNKKCERTSDTELDGFCSLQKLF